MDVAGFSGGFITTVRGKVDVVGYPEFGASVRAASLLLSARRMRPGIALRHGPGRRRARASDALKAP